MEKIDCVDTVYHCVPVDSTTDGHDPDTDLGHSCDLDVSSIVSAHVLGAGVGSHTTTTSACLVCTQQGEHCDGADWLCIKKVDDVYYVKATHAMGRMEASNGAVCELTILQSCIESSCNCVHYIGGAPAALKPCRTFGECSEKKFSIIPPVKGFAYLCYPCYVHSIQYTLPYK